MNDRDFFIVVSETLSEIMDEINNTNYGIAKENVNKLSKIIESYKKDIESRKNLISKNINVEILDKVIEVLSEKLGVFKDKINLDSNIADDLGADSLDQVELIMAYEDVYDIEISDEDAESIKTVKDAVVYLAGKI